jgi:hypothetical protein
MPLPRLRLLRQADRLGVHSNVFQLRHKGSAMKKNDRFGRYCSRRTGVRINGVVVRSRGYRWWHVQWPNDVITLEPERGLVFREAGQVPEDIRRRYARQHPALDRTLPFHVPDTSWGSSARPRQHPCWFSSRFPDEPGEPRLAPPCLRFQ